MAQWQSVVALHRTLSDNCHSYFTKMELCEKIECKPVTFDRLIKILKDQFGAPLINSRLHGGYKYDLKDGETFEIPGMWFKTDELEALICLEGITSSLQKGYLSEAFSTFRKRLKNLLSAQDIDLKEWQKRFKVIPITYRKTDTEVFKIVIEAVLHRQKIKMSYHKLRDNDPQVRIISPQTVLRYRDNWYVDAWCHKSEALRTFTLNRILNAEIVEEEALNVNDADLDQFFAQSYGIFTGQAIYTAEILFTGIAAREVSQEIWHAKQTGEWKTETSYLLRIPYGDSRELIMDILRWGDEAEILGPPELRGEIAKILSNSAKKYKLF